MSWKTPLWLPVLTLFLATPATAQVLFDNSGPEEVWYSGSYTRASDFTLSNAETIGSIDYWAYSSATIFWYVLSGGSQPGSVLFSGSGVGAQLEGPHRQLAVDPFSLGAGSYWLAFLMPDAGFFGHTNDIGHSVSYYDRTGGTSSWETMGTEVSFRMNAVPEPPPAVVPEPGTILLLCTGLAGLGFMAVQRRRDNVLLA